MNGEQEKKNVSANIGGDVEGSVYVAGGNITINASPAEPSVHKLLEQALSLLSLADYEGTADVCSKILRDDRQHPEANLLSGIALLQGQGADRLRSTAITRVEQHLKHAAEHPTTAATALAVLGIAKYDHYVVNGLFEGEPNLNELTQRVKQAGRDNINADLMHHVKSSRLARKRLEID
jgi:hypothetical protein